MPLHFGFKSTESWIRHIIPKSHFSCLEATPPSVIGAMCSKVPYISNAVMKATGCDSFNLLVNNGAAAGQVIYHTHIHIIPRNACYCLWASEGMHCFTEFAKASHEVGTRKLQVLYIAFGIREQ